MGSLFIYLTIEAKVYIY